MFSYVDEYYSILRLKIEERTLIYGVKKSKLVSTWFYNDSVLLVVRGDAPSRCVSGWTAPGCTDHVRVWLPGWRGQQGKVDSHHIAVRIGCYNIT